MDQQNVKEHVQSHARRDKLQEIEKKMQEFWNTNKVYEANPDGRKKFFITFPYPYSNGRLHLGHCFSFSKCEFIARFKRLQGYNVLLPFSFHCTGMPISAAAQKLNRELGLLKKGEVLPENSQYNSLLKMNIKKEEIEKFCDPYYWIHYFPPLGREDITSFGSSVDWRRSFITTDANPYYNAFIEWHMSKLKENGFVKFGKRPSIFSAQDDQMCADHDRKSGEGVHPQEYTLIKQKVLHPEKIDAQLANKHVYMVCATLRPETMYGQTNCFVLPEGEYGVYEMKDDELFICAERAALNMAYQDITKEEKKVHKTLTVKGVQLIGLEVKAPLCTYEKVYVLPMSTIKMNKGTGVVTSVPSDAPDDWAMLRDLQKKPEYYKIQGEWADFKPIPIIEVPKYGELAALKACEEYKIKSPNDKQGLALAKEEVYKLGFYEGVLTVGKYKGMKVQDAKNLVKKDLIDSKEALTYYEPENEVISRNGDECIVSLCDQWYISYDDAAWKEKVLEHLQNNFEAYNPNVKKELVEAVKWIKEWGLSRNFGLGTRLPWDKQYLIESLSDSTIYFAFYTISHYLQSDLSGKQEGTLNIKPEEMTLSAWDYLYLGKDSQELNQALKEKLNIMRKEFLYWYPMNLRCSGKDLIKNHLIFALFNHAAVWKDQPELWPRGYYCNGYVLVNGAKMSKSEGNFRTVQQMVQDYGADATRMGCAEAGDLLDDANYELQVADQAVLKLTTLDMYFSKASQNLDKYRTEANSENVKFLDSVFESQLNYQAMQTIQCYEEIKFRDVVKNGFFILQGNKDDYLVGVGAEGPRRDLILKYIEYQITLLYPIAPHFCEHAYHNYLLPLKKDQNYPATLNQFILPNIGQYVFDANILKQHNYVSDLQRTLRVALQKYKEQLKKQKKPEVVNKVTLVVAKDFYDWQKEVLLLLNSGKIGEKGPEFDYKGMIKANPSGRTNQQVALQLQFANYVLGEYKTRGFDAINPEVTINETQLITLFKQSILSELKLNELDITESTEAIKSQAKLVQQAGSNAQPQKPSVLFE